MNKELRMGAKVEEEHKSTYKYIERTMHETGHIPSFKNLAKSIAKDHLKEDANYYSKLRKARL